MLTSNEIINFLKENKALLREQFNCIEVGLFGSFARNEQTNDSDIDILVVFDPMTPDIYETELGLKNYLKNHFNREVDICAKKWIKPIFKSLIMKDIVYA